MKKFLIMIVSVLSLCVILSISAMAASDITVYVDNEYTEMVDVNGNTVYPFVQNGTTYIPVRGVSQALDCQVEWDGANRNVLIYKDMMPEVKAFRNTTEEIKIYVDNEEQTLYDANGTEVKPIAKNGTTYVPLRGVSKALGYPVEWEGSTKSIYVWKDLVSPNGVTLDFLRPYEIQHIMGWSSLDAHYESDGESIEIDGEYYTNVISGWDGAALFNLNGKYDTLTCVLGPTANLYEEKTVIFIVDGKIAETIVIEPNAFAEEISVDLNKGLQLTIKIDGYAGLGNITFYGE